MLLWISNEHESVIKRLLNDACFGTNLIFFAQSIKKMLKKQGALRSPTSTAIWTMTATSSFSKVSESLMLYASYNLYCKIFLWSAWFDGFHPSGLVLVLMFSHLHFLCFHEKSAVAEITHKKNIFDTVKPIINQFKHFQNSFQNKSILHRSWDLSIL